MKAAFLDRDGVINVDSGYVGSIDRFEFREGIFELLKFLQEKGYVLFIVTNQSGIARGYYSNEDFHTLMDYMTKEFEKRNIEIKDYEYCPHYPEITGACECRKPKPGMILTLVKKYNIDINTSLMIGDDIKDMETAENAGIKRRYFVRDSLGKILEKLKGDL